MKCEACGSTKKLKMRRVHKMYLDSGLENIMLSDVPEYSCPDCGLKYHNYGDMDQLNMLISKRLIRKKGNLIGAEVKFLRKAFGYNSTMFAKLLGIELSTLSRVENASAKPLASTSLDREIRFLVAAKAAPDRDYDLHDSLINDDLEVLESVEMKFKPTGWAISRA